MSKDITNKDVQEIIDMLFEMPLSDIVHDEHRDILRVVYTILIGAMQSDDFGFMAHCLRGVFALGFRAGRKDVRLDVFRDVLKNEENLNENISGKS